MGLLKKLCMEANSLFKIQCPKVKLSKILIRGSDKVEIKVVNHEEVVNQDSNNPLFCSMSLFLFASPSLTLANESFTTPK